jgi:hypothetical protein
MCAALRGFFSLEDFITKTYGGGDILYCCGLWKERQSRRIKPINISNYQTGKGKPCTY